VQPYRRHPVIFDFVSSLSQAMATARSRRRERHQLRPGPLLRARLRVRVRVGRGLRKWQCGLRGAQLRAVQAERVGERRGAVRVRAAGAVLAGVALARSEQCVRAERACGEQPALLQERTTQVGQGESLRFQIRRNLVACQFNSIQIAIVFDLCFSRNPDSKPKPK
jgi:hypothetical protein